MGKKCEDLTGKVFGYLLVLSIAYKKKNKNGTKIYWRCRCLKCGKEVVVAAHDLKSGHSTTCGCGRIGKFTTKTHGMSRTKIYYTWGSMMARCYNPNNKQHDKYGGRGIKVCERWHTFENFYADVSILPHFNEKGYSLDRIDNNGDYCPENVRWADINTQARNKRNNILVEYNGEEMTLPEAAEKSGINYDCLQRRYYRGDRGDRLFRPSEK